MAPRTKTAAQQKSVKPAKKVTKKKGRPAKKVEKNEVVNEEEEMVEEMEEEVEAEPVEEEERCGICFDGISKMVSSTEIKCFKKSNSLFSAT